MNGKTIIQDLAKDLEGFFFNNKLSIKMEFDSNSIHHASYVGSDKNERIRFSKDLCDFEPKNLSDFFFIAIIVCHEFAHYLNSHNSTEDSDNLDSAALETWADYYGARLFMTLLTFGKRTAKSIKGFIDPINQEVILISIGKALADIHKRIYEQNTSRKYQPPLERVSIFCAGITSFFYRLYGEVKVKWSACVNLTIVRAAELAEQLGDNQVEWCTQDTIAKKVIIKHKEIQGHDYAIRKGLKPLWYSFISTNYGLSDAQIEQHKNNLVQQIEKQGIDLRDESFA